MSVNLEARKLSIVEHLSELEDEAIILQIENLLKPTLLIFGKHHRMKKKRA